MKKLLLVLVLIGAGLGGVAYWLSAHSLSSPEGPFTTVPMEYGAITESINATGILKPQQITAVGSPVSGEVVEIFEAAEVNHTVAKGQPLLKLDDRLANLKRAQAQNTLDLAQADVEKAESALQVAQSAFKNVQDLKAKGAVGTPSVDQATLTLRLAESGLKQARLKVQEAQEGLHAAQLGVDLTVVKAPAAGVILERKVFLGQLVAPPASAQLFTIASDLKRMQVSAQIAEGDIGKVLPGQKATFTVYAYSDGNDTFGGTVRETGLMANNVQGATYYSAAIDVDNRQLPGTTGPSGWMLRPGMTANVDIQRRRHEHVWKVPNAALDFQLEEAYQSPEAKAKLTTWERRPDRDDWKFVWVLKEQKPWPVFVRVGGKGSAGETGIRDNQFTEALEWEPDFRPSANVAADYPQVIIGAPPAKPPSIFDKPTLKLS